MNSTFIKVEDCIFKINNIKTILYRTHRVVIAYDDGEEESIEFDTDKKARDFAGKMWKQMQSVIDTQKLL